MKKIYSITCLFVFLLLMGIGVSSCDASAKKLTGKCGKKAKYSYDSQTQTLVISGRGAITESIFLSAPEGQKERYTLKKIIIRGGITDIKTKINKFVRCDIMRVEKLQLPASLRSITKQSFRSFSFQDMGGKFFIPKGVKTLDPAAFYSDYDSNGLREVTVSKKNKYFTAKNGVLFSKDKKTLVLYPREKADKKYTIPSSVKKIEHLAFARNEKIQEVVLPKKLTSLGAGAFCRCRSLSKINLTKRTKIQKIMDYKGSYYSKPVDDDPGLVCHTGAWDRHRDWDGEGSYYLGTFEGTALQSVIIPDSVKYVASDTFKAYWNSDIFETPLKSIYIGKNYIGGINKGGKTEEGGPIYEGQKSLMLHQLPLESVKVSPKNQKYQVKNHALYSKNGKKLYQVIVDAKLPESYEIDAKTTEIAGGAFSWVNTVKELHVKGDLKRIGTSAFDRQQYGVKPGDKYNEFGFLQGKADPAVMTSITIDGNVGKIQDNAFYGCDALQEFHCQGKIQSIGNKSFYACSELSSFTCQGRIDTIQMTAFSKCPKLKNFVDNRPYEQVYP